MIRLMRTRLLLVVFCLLTLAQTPASYAGTVDVPFVFTDDQAAPQNDLGQSIKPSDDLRSNPYLNSPMTRLEYFLTKMETALNDPLTISVLRMSEVEKGFAPGRAEVGIQGFARYFDEKGRIVLGYDIDRLGRPRVPMRDTCHEIVKTLARNLPQEHLGYRLHNTVLGVLAQQPPQAYTPILATLASHFVYRMTLNSTVEDNVHVFRFQKASKDPSITYEKHSFKLSPLPKR